MKNIIRGCILCLIALASGVASAAELTQDSINAVIKKANAGDERAENIVGTWYYTGDNGLPKDYERAVKWWSRSAKKGNALAVGNLGLCYQTGNGVARDSLTAVKLYKRSIKEGNPSLFNRQQKLADGGNVFSAMLMADCYENGIGTGKDAEKSVHYLEIAANNNCREAVDQIGVRLLNVRRAADAAKWFRKSMEGGDLSSTYYYGKLLMEGNGVDRNTADGFNYMLRAAREGFPMAQYQIGECYLSGNGATKNPETAYGWISKAAAAGLAKAQFDLGMAYAMGTEAFPADYHLALIWLTKSADNGYARRVASLFKEGGELRATPFYNYVCGMDYLLNTRDFDKALAEFKVVSKAKHVAGKTMEGVILSSKDYPKYNAKKAAKQLRDAAKTDPYAAFLLGKMYEEGDGIDKDQDMALKYLSEAADAGNAEAQCYLADMYYEGRVIGQDNIKAVDLYRKAAAAGLLTAQAAVRLADCYANGDGGLQPDATKAEALRNGNHEVRIADLVKALVKQ